MEEGPYNALTSGTSWPEILCVGMRVRGSMRALISVYDKAGILDFAAGLREMGVEIVATDGTYEFLQENGIDVVTVSSITDYPEILGGRVKTLHPSVFAAILADRS